MISGLKANNYLPLIFSVFSDFLSLLKYTADKYPSGSLSFEPRLYMSLFCNRYSMGRLYFYGQFLPILFRSMLPELNLIK